jgi:hypothetical protein
LNQQAIDVEHRDGSPRNESSTTDSAQRSSGVQARAEPVPTTETQPTPLVSIRSIADAELLEPTYVYLAAYCGAILAPSAAERVNVAIYELYANALRYGSAWGEVKLELYQRARGVSLVISNHAEPEHLARLEQQVARVQRDAATAYADEMAAFEGGQVAPKLGIVRVAHESGLALSLRVNDARVEVCADYETRPG